MVSIRRAVIVSAAVCGALAVAAYVWFLKPYVLTGSEATAASSALAVVYVLADILLLLAPALALALVMQRFGRGFIAWPWRAVALGAAFIVIGDMAFSYLSAIGEYGLGSWFDFGYMIGHVLIAFGAVIMCDLSQESSYN